MVDSLQHQCIIAVSKHLGSLRSGTDRLVSKELSEQIFNHFRARPIPNIPSSDIAKDLIKWFDLRFFTLDTLTYSEHDVRVASAKNLERFEFFSSHKVPYGTDSELRNRKEEEEEKLSQLLPSLVNGRSSIRELQLEMVDVEFDRDWGRLIMETLPNLESLSFTRTIIPMYKMQSFFADCHQLKNLDLSGTNLTNINGISCMKNLEVLNISHLQFKTTTDIEDVFELQDLRELHIAFYDEQRVQPDLFSLYLKCGKALSNLTLLNCSYNVINQRDYETLVDTHASLKDVVLIGTTLEKLTDPARPHLRLLNSATALSCWSAIQFSLNREVEKILRVSLLHPSLYYLTMSFSDLVKWPSYEEVSERMRKEIYDGLLKLFNAHNIDVSSVWNTVYSMLRDGGSKILSISEKSELVALVFKNQKLEPVHWALLAEPDILLNGLTKLGNIFRRAASEFRYQPWERCENSKNLIKIITMCMDLLHLEDVERIVEPTTFPTEFCKFLVCRHNAIGRNQSFFVTVLHLAEKMLFLKSHEKQSTEAVKTMLGNLGQFTGKPEIQVKMLKLAERYMETRLGQEECDFIFNMKDVFMMLVACLEEIDSDSHPATVSLFVTVMHKRPEFQGMSTQQRIQEILSSLKLFQKTEEMDNKWSIFRWIVEKRVKDAGAVEWARWILEHDGDVKALEAKRRRT